MWLPPCRRQLLSIPLVSSTHSLTLLLQQLNMIVSLITRSFIIFARLIIRPSERGMCFAKTRLCCSTDPARMTELHWPVDTPKSGASDIGSEGESYRIGIGGRFARTLALQSSYGKVLRHAFPIAPDSRIPGHENKQNGRYSYQRLHGPALLVGEKSAPQP